MTNNFTHIDLFAGAGGLSEGLSMAGFHSIYANEIIPIYASSYARNHIGAKVETEDIRKIDAEKIREDLGLIKGELSLLAGGPPCQGFSINAPVRSIEDKRNHLFIEFLRFVKAFMPKVVLIENVPGLVSFDNGATLYAILESLANLGYGSDVRILGAAHYGVPQMRWRTFIIAFRGAELPSCAFPNPIYHAPIKPNFTSTFAGRNLVYFPSSNLEARYTTVYEAIGDLPPLQCGEKGEKIKDYACEAFSEYQKSLRKGSIGVLNHESPSLSKQNIERMSFIPQGGNWTDIPFDMLPKGMQKAKRTDHTKRYGRVSKDGLASTILTKCDPHWGAFIHYDQDRSFTVREAARIQSFPDHFIFNGNMAEQFAQVGNAVPPLLAKAVGECIYNLIENF